MRLIIYYLFCGCLFTSLLPAEEFLTQSSIASSLSDLREETLVVFDIDDTLIRADKTLSTLQWFVKREKEPDSHWEKDKALCIELLQDIEVELVEESLLTWINTLQKQGITCIAISARPAVLLDHTLRQLESVGIHFSSKSLDWSLPAGFAFKEGVLFVSHEEAKGQGLGFYLDHHDQFSAIIVLDDKYTSLREMKTWAKKRPVEFIGIHYLIEEETFSEPIAERYLDMLFRFLPHSIS